MPECYFNIYKVRKYCKVTKNRFCVENIMLYVTAYCVGMIAFPLPSIDNKMNGEYCLGCGLQIRSIYANLKAFAT